MNITVVGLGKIGLPLAVQYAKKGHTVIGVDINPSTVNLVNDGIEPFPGEFGLESSLRLAIAEGQLSATMDTEMAVSKSNVVVVAVPLFVDKEGQPEFGAMDSATSEISKGLKRGTLVSYETTLPVGTTRKRLSPLLEEGSGLKAGEDFFVVFSPERVLTGRVFEDLRKYPKLVGGINSRSEEEGVAFYQSVLDFDGRPDLPRANGVWALGSVEAAEFAKLAETTYRDVNIGLANQFALEADRVGVDVYKVIEACNSQQFSHIHQPGIAVGGHCIPVYPHLYLIGDPKASIVEEARRVNKQMPVYAIEKIESHLGSLNGCRIAVLGLAYRGGVKEHAFSGAWDLVHEISRRGGMPLVHDPLYSDSELVSMGLSPFALGDSCDAVIIQADHEVYSSLVGRHFPGAQMLVDGRNCSSLEIRSQIHTHVIGAGGDQ
jgi:nucleotide sugar dehydrogenase